MLFVSFIGVAAIVCLGFFFFLCYLGELNLQLCRLAKRCTDAHVVLPTTTKPSVSSVF